MARRWPWRDDEPDNTRHPRPLQESLAEVAAELQLDDPEVLKGVLLRWPDVVGEVVAAHVHPRVLRQGVLFLDVDGPEWATQLRYLEEEILRRLARKVRPGAVTGIRVAVRRPPA